MDKQTMESFTIDSFESYKSFLQMLETHTIDKHFKLNFSQFKDKNDYFQFLGVGLENFKAVKEETGASSFSTKAESVSSSCSNSAPKHENLQKSDHPVAMIRNSFKRLVSFELFVADPKITFESLLIESASPEEFARLARYLYNLSSDGLKEFYINDGLQEFPDEPYSRSTPINEEVFFKVYEQCMNKRIYLEAMTTKLFIEKISQEFLVALPTTLKKINLSYGIEIYLNLSSSLKHLSRIESIDLWGEYFADPKTFILPQLKSFSNCLYLKMPFDLFENMLEFLNEESNGAANDVDLSKRKIQELSSKIGFQNLKRLKIITLKKNYIEGDKLIQLKLIPSLQEVMFSGWIGLWIVEC